MKCAILVLVLVTFSSANPTPPAPEITSPRSATEIGETIKQLTNQLMEVNTTSEIMMDTRTPPKIKQHAKKKPKPQLDFENSHAGVAIPIDEDDLAEETTKKLSFYKFERPTTNSGLSTWILLSGQTTPKPSKKPVVKPSENQNATFVAEPNKVIKPIFKKRVSTTRKPTTPRTTRVTEATLKTTKLNKIKASILNNAKKTTVAPSTTTSKKNSTTIITSKKTTTVSSSTTPKIATTTPKTVNGTLPTNSSSTLPLEPKDGDTELEKTKRPTTTSKRKKNKNRRRRPESKNSTKIEKSANKHKTKENPISTQFYNYLQREVMPTVGVGLVGLMVTAGLASYFLYPFGAARRSYDIDRRDKEGTYYYSDQYSGGIAEEEAIGKVIAGMPENSLYSTYKTPSSRKSFSNRQVNNHRVSQGSVETVAVNDYNSYQPVTYSSNKETYNSNKENTNVEKETKYTVDDRKFVVGNTPKEDVTPAAVPEHGPRSLRIRRETKIPETKVSEDEENEIESEEQQDDDEEEVTTAAVEEPTTTTAPKPEDSVLKFVEFFRDLVHFKVNVGLQLVRKAADAVSKYASEMQGAVDEHYKNTTMRNKDVKLS